MGSGPIFGFHPKPTYAFLRGSAFRVRSLGGGEPPGTQRGVADFLVFPVLMHSAEFRRRVDETRNG